MKKIAIIGSTGSIGTQALEVVKEHSEIFKVEVLTANTNANLLIKQAKEFLPSQVVIVNQTLYSKVKKQLKPKGISVHTGKEALEEVIKEANINMVLTAVVGYSGLKSTIAAIKAGKDIALANKETLVVAGELITSLAIKHKVTILPVDSEHSAIFQCLVGEQENPIEKIILTASGGPFRGRKRQDLLEITKEQALKHPNWNMGAKITIDSASLMNKGLEVIEAKWLFNLDSHQIEVVVHPQSIIHSLVQFEDGSLKAQLGLPDMKLPIQYAMGYPKRLKSTFEKFNFMNFKSLTFEKPDKHTFRNLQLAYNALDKLGNYPCILNAANEIAVEKFLNDKIKFLQIAELNEICLEKIQFIKSPNLDDYIATDIETRKVAEEIF